MQKFSTLTDAIELARFAHRSQTDSAGLPYIEHPLRVLEKVKAQGALPYVQIAAVLHDVTEDSRFTPDMLRDLGFPEPAVEIIKLMDRGYSKKKYHLLGELNGQNHESTWSKAQIFVAHHSPDEFYYWDGRGNPGFVVCKNADMDDNTEPWRLSYFSEERQAYLINKYTKGRKWLNEGVE